MRRHVLLLSWALAGCVTKTGFVCQNDAQCLQAGVQGRCEAVGYCSFADSTCSSGSRFGDEAGGLSGVCVGGSGDGGPGGGSCIAEIAAGAHFSCARKTGGGVWCWGNNDSVQLGDATYQPHSTPLELVGLPPVARLALGGYFGCALTGDNHVWCWGDNSYYQLADAFPQGNHSSQPVAGEAISLVGATVLSGGYQTACAIKAGTVYCWGLNDQHQTGEFTTVTSKRTPVAVTLPGGAGTPTAVAVGGDHACAVAGGAVYCWGADDVGQLGNNMKTPTPILMVVPVMGISGTAVEVAAGYAATCARTDQGAVYCWGANGTGTLGDGSTMDRATAVHVSLTDPALHLSSRAGSMCAVNGKNEAWCWGYDSYGQLGDDQRTYSVERPYRSLLNVRQAAPGENHLCGLHLDGSVACFGDDSSGQLGDGVVVVSYAPMDVVGLANAVGLATGGMVTCARRGATGTTVSCWGANDYGALGDGSDTDQAAPMTSVYAQTGVAEVAAGNGFACSRDGSNAVWCWGYGYDGELGDNGSSSKNLPQPVYMLGAASQLTAGYQHACALKTDQTVWCWGSNGEGQLGDDSQMTRHAPVQVTFPTLPAAVADIRAGSGHTCARLANGDLWCWGDNSDAQLGLPTTTARSLVPIQVTAVSSVLEVAAGRYHTCVRLAGAVKCWGAGYAGQLGDGNYGTSVGPVTVYRLTTATQLSARAGTTCALKSDAPYVQCWGENDSGQIGDGTSDNRGLPTAPTLGGTPVEVQVGDGYACARRSDGTAACWGQNSDGQLGIGAVLVRLSAVAPGLTCP